MQYGYSTGTLVVPLVSTSMKLYYALCTRMDVLSARVVYVLGLLVVQELSLFHI